MNRLPRLQATIETTSGNKIKTDPAMNDLLIANTHQYALKISHEKRSNRCQTSLQWPVFSTWLGQGAWFNQIARESNLGNAADSDTHYLVIARTLMRKSPMKGTCHGQVRPL